MTMRGKSRPGRPQGLPYDPVLLIFLVFLELGCGLAQPEGMVLISEGSFWMGAQNAKLEEEAAEFGISKPMVLDAMPARRIYLPAFFIDRTEVTNRAYYRFTRAAGFPELPQWRSGRPDPDQEELPVAYVSWPEANAYCRWRGKRLPTEAEWEKAARGPDGWIYPWGYFFDPRRANVGGLRSGPMPVGSLPMGKSLYGANDMIGNVWEWTADWYGPYTGSSYSGDEFGKRFRVVRGSSWAGLGHFPQDVLEKVRAMEARASYRMFFPPNVALEDLGFRCVQDLPKGSAVSEGSAGR